MTKVKTPSQDSIVATNNSSLRFESTVEKLSTRRRPSERSHTFQHIVASPIHYEPNYAYPLLVWLHSSEKNEKEVCEVAPKISAQNYVAVAPRGLLRQKRRVIRSCVNNRLVDEKSWMESYYDWSEDEASVSEAENLVFDSIEQASIKFNINPRRIFILGRGAGGTMALRVGLRNPREFAGIVSIDGAFPSFDNLPLRCWRAARDLPILMTTGSENSTSIPRLSNRRLRLFHTAGMTVVIRQYNDKSNSPQSAQQRMNRILSDVNKWTMERALNPHMTTSELYGSF